MMRFDLAPRRGPGRPRNPERIPDPPPSGTRRLPMLVAGRGEHGATRRDDCSSYGDCLGRLVKASPLAHTAHCPDGCADFAAVSRDELLACATVARPHALAGLPEGFEL